MNNQEILDNAPEGATHVLLQSINYIYIKFGVYTESFMYCNHKEGWRLATHVFHSNLRALSDIKRIAELERVLAGTEACLGITGYIKKDSLAHTEIQDVLKKGGAE